MISPTKVDEYTSLQQRHDKLKGIFGTRANEEFFCYDNDGILQFFCSLSELQIYQIYRPTRHAVSSCGREEFFDFVATNHKSCFEWFLWNQF